MADMKLTHVYDIGLLLHLVEKNQSASGYNLDTRFKCFLVVTRTTVRSEIAVYKL